VTGLEEKGVLVAWFLHAHHNGLYETAVMEDGTTIELFEVFKAGYRGGFASGLDICTEGVVSD